MSAKVHVHLQLLVQTYSTYRMAQNFDGGKF